MTQNTSRRQFIRNSAGLSAGMWALGTSHGAWAAHVSPNDKLAVAIIGAGGRGRAHVDGIGRLRQNIVALCDVDEKNAKPSVESPYAEKANFYHDYRQLLDNENNVLDAVMVATPDHMHAPISLRAMRMGLHCYCEKPLTHSVEEARAMTKTARKYGVVTQMGNQGSSNSGFRAGVEKIQSGVIGPVKDVYVWTNRPVWTQAVHRPTTLMSPPDTLDWDLWLGSAPWRPYHSIYMPFHWRGWYDFGTGALGDMACHTMNLPYRALNLGAPESVEVETSELFPESYPEWSVIKYNFPARGDQPPVTLHWYDGGKNGKKPPQDLLFGKEMPGSGMVMVGEKGNMFSENDYGTRQFLLPEGDFENYKNPPRTLPRTGGHHLEWVQACKGETETYSSFDFAGPFTEAVLLGNLAMRAQKKIIWDTQRMECVGAPELNALIRREYTQDFEI